MIRLSPIVLVLIIGFSSCKKEEPVEEVIVDDLIPEENPKNAEITLSSENYSSLEIQVNGDEVQETTFPVFIGDTINVDVTNDCWTYIYYGLGDTVGTELVDCNVIGISLYLNSSYVAGSTCSAPFPYTCETSYLSYIVQ